MFVFHPDEDIYAAREITVDTVTVDSLYQEYSPSADKTVFIWADIEGAELRMLRGAEKTLRSGNVIGLNLELWPRNAHNIWPTYTGNRCTADQVTKFLKGFGFSYRSTRQNGINEETDPTFEAKGWFGDWLFTPETK